MRVDIGRQIHVTYCTNVHAGETWPEVLHQLKGPVLDVRERVASGRPFGLGLRLAETAVRALEDPKNRRALRAFLDDHDCYVFTLNGFPYGQFHGGRVKEAVFAPDWTTPERLDYTLRLAELLAELLPEGVEGSLSTSPGSFKAWITEEAHVNAIVENLARAAAHLERLAQSTGRSLTLGLEPEPLGWLETTGEVCEFFERRLRPHGASVAAELLKVDPRAAESVLRRRIGVCYDACHLAVEFEPPAMALKRLLTAGIRLSKCQISSALRLKPAPATLAALARFAEGVYLHQVVARLADGRLIRWPDIGDALRDRDRLLESEEVRVHCHVPLTMSPLDGLESTSGDIPALLRHLKDAPGAVHFEVETYTWDVLPEGVRRPDVAEAIAEELTWFLERLGRLRERRHA